MTRLPWRSQVYHELHVLAIRPETCARPRRPPPRAALRPMMVVMAYGRGAALQSGSCRTHGFGGTTQVATAGASAMLIGKNHCPLHANWGPACRGRFAPIVNAVDCTRIEVATVLLHDRQRVGAPRSTRPCGLQCPPTTPALISRRSTLLLHRAAPVARENREMRFVFFAIPRSWKENPIRNRTISTPSRMSLQFYRCANPRPWLQPACVAQPPDGSETNDAGGRRPLRMT